MALLEEWQFIFGASSNDFGELSLGIMTLDFCSDEMKCIEARALTSEAEMACTCCYWYQEGWAYLSEIEK